MLIYFNTISSKLNIIFTYMKTGEILLIILIPLAVLLLSVILYVGFKTFISTSKNKVIEYLEEELNLGRLQQADVTITKVEAIAVNNKEYKNVFASLEEQYEKLDSTLMKAEGRIKELKEGKFKKAEFNNLKTNILSLLEAANKFNKNFNNISSQITQQDDFLSAEKAYLSKNLRIVIEVYQQKRIILDSISQKIDALSNNIKNISKEFDALLSNAENRAASLKLNDYSKEIHAFAQIISEAPKIDSYLKNIIPVSIKELNSKYQKVKEKIHFSIPELKFKDQIMHLSSLFNIALDSYNNLKMNVAKKNVKEIMTTINAINAKLDTEDAAFDFIKKNESEVIAMTKKNVATFNAADAKIKSIISRGRQITPQLNSAFKILSEKQEALKEDFIAYKELMKDKDSAFSKKLQKMKSIINKNKGCMNLINEVIKHIWSLDIEASMIKNKYSKFESAINEILSNTKQMKMKLNPELKDEYQYISEKMSRITRKLDNDFITEDLKQEVEDLSKKVSSFYSIVNGNLQISEIFNNLMQEFGSIRRIDPKMNSAFLHAEHEFLDGNYSNALNLLISSIEKKGV